MLLADDAAGVSLQDRRVPLWPQPTACCHDCSVFIHGGVSTPFELTDAMPTVGKLQSLENVEVFHIHTTGDAKYATDPRFKYVPGCESGRGEVFVRGW
jgi:hypothetical protein